MLEVCYGTVSEKNHRFYTETLPAIAQQVAETLSNPNEQQALKNWLRVNQVIPGSRGPAMLQRLHQAARAGQYVPTERHNCDRIQPVSETIKHGGDCDQWSTVLLAALWQVGVTRTFLVTTGTHQDPILHIATAASLTSMDLSYFDPKPNQQGVVFDERADSFPLMRFHQMHYGAKSFSHNTPLGFHHYPPANSRQKARTW